MRKGSKVPKIVRKCYTEEAQTYYPQHLILRKKKLFTDRLGNPQESNSLKRQSFAQQTNFGFTATHEYIFVLLHLQSKDNKNMLNLNVPQICVFVQKMPYDILYAENGFVRGFRIQQAMKCRLRDVEVMFKEVWKNKKLPKNQHVTAVFKQKQVLIMSQTDFIIACKKIKSDPFFKKLQYIQNKLPYIGQQIVTEYDHSIKQQSMLKMATQSLLGFKNQRQLMDQLGEQRYLNFLNQKITLALNYQHNIRVTKANFHYVKTQAGQYYLVNVTNLQLNNLTKALQLRQQKLKKIDQARDRLLELNPQRERKFKSYQNPQDVKKIQKVLKQNFQTIVKKMNFMSISESKNEEIKNELAFRKLHPQVKVNYQQLLTSNDFKKTRQKIFGSTINGRKPISIPSKYILRSYNKVKRSYTMCTEEGESSQIK